MQRSTKLILLLSLLLVAFVSAAILSGYASALWPQGDPLPPYPRHINPLGDPLPPIPK